MTAFFRKKWKYCRGEAVFTVVIFLLFASLAVISGLVSSVANSSGTIRELLNSKKSYFLSEGGGEDIIYRILREKNYSSEEVLALDGYFATTTVNSVDIGPEIDSSSNINNDIRKVKVNLASGAWGNFGYAIQLGDGGLIMENSPYVTGNVYSNGPINGYASNDSARIKGSAFSAGPSGLAGGIIATKNVYAHTIDESTINKDAYYQEISDSTVGGVLYPNSSDQSFLEMPISDQTLDDWEQAATTTVISSPCPYTISSGKVTLGQTKITCDLVIKSSAKVYLKGSIWVTGNIVVQGSAKVYVDPSLGKKSVVVIADNPGNRLTSSGITLSQTTVFYNSGTAGSYILFVSRNNSAENGGTQDAIQVQNSAYGALVVYAPHGEIDMANSVKVKGVAAYKAHLHNSVRINYETALSNLLFEAGPTNSLSVNSWREIK